MPSKQTTKRATIINQSTILWKSYQQHTAYLTMTTHPARCAVCLCHHLLHNLHIHRRKIVRLQAKTNTIHMCCCGMSRAPSLTTTIFGHNYTSPTNGILWTQKRHMKHLNRTFSTTRTTMHQQSKQLWTCFPISTHPDSCVVCQCQRLLNNLHVHRRRSARLHSSLE